MKLVLFICLILLCGLLPARIEATQRFALVIGRKTG